MTTTSREGEALPGRKLNYFVIGGGEKPSGKMRRFWHLGGWMNPLVCFFLIYFHLHPDIKLGFVLTEITLVSPKPNKILGQSTGISLVPGLMWRGS